MRIFTIGSVSLVKTCNVTCIMVGLYFSRWGASRCLSLTMDESRSGMKKKAVLLFTSVTLAIVIFSLHFTFYSFFYLNYSLTLFALIVQLKD